jgi:putative ABC transport system permease protein
MGTPVRSLTRRRLRGDIPPSHLRLADLGSEALAGLLQRPGRSALTLLGVILGIGSFVTIVGIAQTASGQIGKQFNVLQATQAYVFDVGAAQSGARAVDFPPNADALAGRIHGVVAAGVYWAVHFKQAAVSAYASGFLASQRALPVTAASPGLLAAAGVKLVSGTLFNQFHETHAQNVAVLGESVAAGLGITSLVGQPAIFIDGQPFTVVGIIASSQRLPQLGVGVTVPESTALRLWGAPTQEQAQMLIHTTLGAAKVVAEQAAVAIRPDNPTLLKGAAAPSAAQLQRNVSTSLNTLFLILAGIALVVGAVGIANTTLVAVLERGGDRAPPRAGRAAPPHRDPVPDRIHRAGPVRRADRGQPGRGHDSGDHHRPALDRVARPAHRDRRPGCGRRGGPAGRPVSRAAGQRAGARRCATPLRADPAVREGAAPERRTVGEQEARRRAHRRRARDTP